MKLVSHLLHDAVEVRADAVHLVDERDFRHMILLRLTPNLLGLRLDAANGAIQRHRAIKNAQRTLDLCGEVDVSGSINQRKAVIAPGNASCCGLDCNATLLLLNHEVHSCRAIMHLANLIALSRIVQNTFGSGCLATINVGHDAEVAHSLKRYITLCHLILFLFTYSLLASGRFMTATNPPSSSEI